MITVKEIQCRCPWCRLEPDQSLHRISKLLHEPQKPMSAEQLEILRDIVNRALRRSGNET